MLSPAQYSCLSLISSEGSKYVGSVNTMTLASLMRRGLVNVKGRKATGKYLTLTILGEKAYEFELTRKIRAWKEELAEARKIKGTWRQ